MKLILESWRNYVAEEKEKKCPKCGKSPCVCPKKEEVNEEDLSLKDAVDAEEEGESDRVEMEETNIAQQSQKDMAQARKDVSFGTSPEEKEEVSKLTSMIIAFSKKKDLTKGRVAKLIDLLKQEMIKQAKLSAEPEEPMEEEKIKNPGKYMGGDRQKAGVDDDGDGVPNKADKNPKDGSKK